MDEAKEHIPDDTGSHGADVLVETNATDEPEDAAPILAETIVEVNDESP